MNEEQLAELLAQQLDTLLAGDSLPETLSPEIADLLSVAQSLSATTPQPRPEFGPALKESLLGPNGTSIGAAPPTNPAWGGLTLSIVVIGLLSGVALIAVIATIIFLGGSSSTAPNMPTATSLPTQTTPAQPTPLSTIVAPTVQTTPTAQITSAPTATPIIDLLPVITITVEIKIEPPGLVPGFGRGGEGGSNGGGNTGGGSGDHDKGHGNDDDHHDDDNPGKGGKD